MLRKKFELETGTKWKQFDKYVFKWLDYPLCKSINECNEESYKLYKRKIPFDVRKFFHESYKYIDNVHLIGIINHELVVDENEIEDFISYILYFYEHRQVKSKIILFGRNFIDWRLSNANELAPENIMQKEKRNTSLEKRMRSRYKSKMSKNHRMYTIKNKTNTTINVESEL